MKLAKLIKASTMGGVILIGLNLLSQPAQAISIFSFGASDNGSIPVWN